MSTNQLNFWKLISSVLLAALVGIVIGKFMESSADAGDRKADSAIQAKVDDKQDGILADHAARLSAHETKIENLSNSIHQIERKQDVSIEILTRLERNSQK
jgi:uncharacterized membrane protein YraQ (UPF0718 family)